MRSASALPLLLLAALPACSGVQSATGGGGFHSEQFSSLFMLVLGVAIFFYLLTIGFMLAALLRKRGDRQDGLEESPGDEDRGPLRKMLVGWTGLVVLGLTLLIVASYLADRDSAAARPLKPIKIQIVAHQWWWDVRYLDPVPAHNIRTANELHLPVGVPVHITLKSNDVIHSFWVPRLAGKQDMIPGRVNDMFLIPKRVGRYRGECAEFCGMQHAHMALDVTVEPREQFDAWVRSQIAPAAPPTTPLAVAGHNYFMNRECSACHRIAGTPANGQVGPDLTHVASRQSIGAGTLPMGRGQLYAWVADPQGAKPGNHMPYIGLEPQQLHSVVAYLETLK